MDRGARALAVMVVLALAGGLVTPAPGRGQGSDASADAPPGGASPSGVSEIVYLNFSDGTENLTFASSDDAVANRSNIGAAMPFPAFGWPAVATGATTRAEVIRRVVKR